MTQKIEFFVPGEAVAQARPRATTRGGRVRFYDVPKSANYKALLALAAERAAKKQEWKLDVAAPLSLVATAYLSIPVSRPKKWQARAENGEVFPTKKPDADNILKAVQDALSGVLYLDDRQIVDAVVCKRYGAEPGLAVRLEHKTKEAELNEL